MGEDSFEAKHPEMVLGWRLGRERIVQDLKSNHALSLFLFGDVVTRYLVVEKTSLHTHTHTQG